MLNLFRIKLFSLSGIAHLFKAIASIGINLSIIPYLSSKLFKNEIALCFEDQTYTYHELYESTLKTANYLSKTYPLKKKQKIGIACSNHATQIFLLFASAYLGLDIYLLNAEMSENQLLKLKEKHCFDLFIDDSFTINLDSNTDIKSNKSYYNKIVVLTSGSTGDHKIAQRKSSIKSFISPFCSLINNLGLIKYKSVYLATPIYHGFGIITLCVSFLLGARLYISSRFDTKKACHIIEEGQIEVVTLVPLMLQRMLDYNTDSLRSLRCVISGGAPLSSNLIELTQNTLSKEILYNLYGSSEAGFCIMANPKDLIYSSQTIGKPIKGVDVQINQIKDEYTKSQNPIGEICIRCAWSIRPNQWIKTGDIGYKDKNGYYYLSGRKDDMIVSGGENVYPYDLEQVLGEHPMIKEIVVVAINDDEFGSRFKAFVITDQSKKISEQEIFTWLSKRIARYQMPKEIIFIKEIPLNSVGKPDKKRLLKMKKE